MSLSSVPRSPRRTRVRVLVGVLLLALVAVAGVAVAAVLLGDASLAPDASGFAAVDVDALGGTLAGVSAHDAHGRQIPLTVDGGRILPRAHVAPGTVVTVAATVTRPSWSGWALGRSSHARLTLRAPSAPLRTRWTTLRSGAGLKVGFAAPVARLAYGTAGHLHHVVLHHPRRTIDLGPQAAAAGTLLVSGAPRTWERLPAARTVSWFPAGSTPTAVADPAPGAQIAPLSKLTLTFSKPIGTARPRFAAPVAGRWRRRDSHTLVFAPSGTGFGLGAHVQLTLPAGVKLANATSTAATTVSTTTTTAPGTTVDWTVPPGSPLRLHELLAQLGYLPLGFHSDDAPVAADDGAQLQAAVDPPHGSFAWKWKLPGQLTSQWNPDAETAITRGALMAFQSDRQLTVDGLAGPSVWSALIAAARKHQKNPNGYSYVLVHRDAAQQTATLIHDGRTIVTTPGNTGVAAAPTDLGTFPVYLRFEETTMSGTNPDGSRYVDPGIKWVSYFNGGDALHAFDRASYGTPQSVGCVELPEAAAATIYPYTPIGTLVTIAA